MLRNHFISVVASAFFAAQPLSANAQQEEQPDAYIADLWQVYVSTCGLLLEDTQRFLDFLPPENSRGGPNFVRSPDEALLVSSTAHDGFIVDADVIEQSGERNISCHVFPSFGRFGDLKQFEAIEIEAALKRFLESTGVQHLAGGELLNAYTSPQDGDEVEYQFATEAILSGVAVLTRFEMTEGDLAVYYAGIILPAGD